MDGEISIVGLGRLEAVELQQDLGSQGVIQDSKALASTKQGEIATVALVVAILPSIIGLIGLWLSRPSRRKTFSYKVVVKDKKGVVREEAISFDEYATEAPSEKVAKAFSKVLQVPVEKIKDLMEEAEKAGGEE
jgi:hypothetical protein